MILLKENPALFRTTVDSVLQRVVANGSGGWAAAWNEELVSVGIRKILPLFILVAVVVVAATFTAFASHWAKSVIDSRARHRRSRAAAEKEKTTTMEDGNGEDDVDTVGKLREDNRSLRRAITRLTSELIALDGELVRAQQSSPADGVTPSSGLAGRYATTTTSTTNDDDDDGPTPSDGGSKSAKARGARRVSSGRLGRRSSSRRSSTTVEDGEWDYGI